MGVEKDTLLTVAANLVPFGPRHLWFLGQGLVPNPTVKKKCRSMVRGTLTGYCVVYAVC